MNFKPELMEKVLAGSKIVTRRPAKVRAAKDGELGFPQVEPCRYKVGKVYGVAMGMGRPSIGWIHVLSVDLERLGQIDADDAEREGFASTDEFRWYWHDLYDGFEEGQLVWRIRFEISRAEFQVCRQCRGNGYVTESRNRG